MDYVDRLFAWFRHLIVKCEEQKHRLLIFFCDYTFNYKNNVKKKNKKTYALSCLKFKSFSVFTNYPSADGNLVQVTQIWVCPIHTI